MKPITDWLQNDAINELVDRYGAYLEKLTPDIRREVIAALADDFYFSQENPELEAVLLPLIDLTLQERDQLIVAIATSLIQKPTKKGTPFAPGMPSKIGC